MQQSKGFVMQIRFSSSQPIRPYAFTGRSIPANRPTANDRPKPLFGKSDLFVRQDAATATPAEGINNDANETDTQPNMVAPANNEPNTPVTETPEQELDPDDPESIIEAILEDVEEEPALHQQLTTLRAAYPAMQRFSEQQPQEYIESLRNVINTYTGYGVQAANQMLTQLIRQATENYP